jgi:hypothetical protein
MGCGGYYERYCGVVLDADNRSAFEGESDLSVLELQTDTIPVLELSSFDNGVVVSVLFAFVSLSPPALVNCRSGDLVESIVEYLLYCNSPEFLYFVQRTVRTFFIGFN